VQRGQRLQDRRRALDDPDRLAAPLHDQALALLQGADVHRHRRAGELGPGAGVPGLDERDCREPGAHGAHRHRRGRQEPTPALVIGLPAVGGIQYRFVGHPALRETFSVAVLEMWLQMRLPRTAPSPDAGAKNNEVYRNAESGDNVWRARPAVFRVRSAICRALSVAWPRARLAPASPAAAI